MGWTMPEQSFYATRTPPTPLCEPLDGIEVAWVKFVDLVVAASRSFIFDLVAFAYLDVNRPETCSCRSEMTQ